MRRLAITFWSGTGALVLAGCVLVVENKLEPRPDPLESLDGGSDASRTGDAGLNPQAEAGTDMDDGAVEASSAQLDSGLSPSGQGLQVSLGQSHACAVNTQGKMTCWGANLEDQGKFPADRSYSTVACGDYHSCALDTAGALVCVGRNRDGQRASDPGPFVQVAAGDAHTCVRSAAGQVRCFGLDNAGQASAPAKTFLSITAGAGFSCGVREVDGKVECWGVAGAELTAAVAQLKFASIDAGRDSMCGVTEDGNAKCWNGFSAPALGSVSRLSVGGYGTCALLPDRSVRCWSGAELEMPFAEQAPFVDVIVGGDARCLVPETGSILCEPVDGSAVAPGPKNFD